MRIGIFTFHRAYNCGAMLQAWALKRVLEKSGHSVRFPLVTRVGDETHWFVREIPEERKGIAFLRSLIGRLILDLRLLGRHTYSKQLFVNFRERYLPEIRCSAKNLRRKVDCIVVGSDQVWNKSLVYNSSSMLGSGVPTEIPMIAYAASYGDSVPSGIAEQQLVTAVRRFKDVSVREDSARKFFGFRGVPNVKTVLDPTLLLSSTDYDAIADFSLVPTRPYLYAYLLYGSDFEVNTAKRLATELGVDLVVSTGSSRGRKNNNVVSPEQFVGLMQKAKYVIACSFHGTAFAIINRKQFISLRPKVDTEISRPAELLLKLNLQDRLASPKTELEVMKDIIQRPLPLAVDSALAQARKCSLDFLFNALGGSHEDDC